MANELNAGTVLSFADGSTEYSLVREELRLTLHRGGEVITGLDQEALYILTMLVEDALLQQDLKKRLVSYDRIHRKIWTKDVKGRVSAVTLRGRTNKEISELRDILKDEQGVRVSKGIERPSWERGRIIGTVRNHGYRLMLSDVWMTQNKEQERVQVVSERRSTPVGPLSLSRGLLSSVIGSVMEIQGTVIVPKLEALQDIGEQVTFVEGDELIEECGRLNAQAFTGLWRGSYKTLPENKFEKTERNRRHVKRNPFVLVLMKAVPWSDYDPAFKYIGFTHIIPLTHQGYARYCNGDIEDNALPEDVICKIGEKARALLIFSAAIDPKSVFNAYRKMSHKERRSVQFRYKIKSQLARCLVFHIHKMMELYVEPSQTIELIAQTDGAHDVAATLLSLMFQPTGKVSRDKYEIWKSFGKRPDILGSGRAQASSTA